MSELTKKALASSLKSFLEEESISKVTIGKLCERTGIRRQTFYYHFGDLPELIEWICYTEAEEVLSQKNDYQSWEEGFLSVFKLAEKEKPFIMNIYHGVSKDTLQRYLYNLTFPLLRRVVNEVANSLGINDVTESDKGFIERFYTIAFVDVMMEWVARNMSEAPEEIISHLSPLVKGTIPNALNAYSGRN